MNTLDSPTLLNASQAARRLDCCPATLTRFINRGLLKPDATDGRGHALFRADKVDELAKAKATN